MHGLLLEPLAAKRLTRAAGERPATGLRLQSDPLDQGSQPGSSPLHSKGPGG